MILPGSNVHASYGELEAFVNVSLKQLRYMSMRAQLVACELQKVDKNNKIFDPKEGVLDKKHLYMIRKMLKDGEYERLRDKVRII